MKTVKLLKPIKGLQKAVGDTFSVENDDTADMYIEGGFAQEVKSDSADQDAVIASLVNKAVKDLVADAAKANGKKGTGPVFQGEYTSPDQELNGLAVFGSKGGFLHSVRDYGNGSPTEDTIHKMSDWQDVQRKAAVTTKGTGSPSGNFEANDPDGAVLVIPEFAQGVYERMQLEENFLADCENLVVRGNTLTLPAIDDSSRVDGSRWGAVQGFWANEAENYATVSKPKYRQMDLRLKKLYIVAYITDELLADSTYALEKYVTNIAGKELAFKTNDAMIRGTGAGQPLGILNSPSLITVAAENGQATKTILLANIENMWMRLNYFYRKDAVWLINQDCEKQLQLMAFPVGIAGVPIYQPQGGVSNPAYATLKGRPVKIVEFAETLGTSGDIILTNWRGYQAITKGGVKSDISMHVRFLFGEMAYRFTYRMDGQPLWDKPLTPYKGTNTTSPSVVLASR